jgi:hypothetical protein
MKPRMNAQSFPFEGKGFGSKVTPGLRPNGQGCLPLSVPPFPRLIALREDVK